MKNTRWFFFLFCLMASVWANAQQSTRDVVYLKDGTAYWGNIVTEEPGRRVFIRLSGGDIIAVKHELIAKIEKGVSAPLPTEDNAGTSADKTKQSLKTKKQRTEEPQASKLYMFRETGLYNAASLGVNFADGENENVVGLGFHYVSGYQFNRWIGAGLGFGLDAYSLNRSEMILPVFAEARGYFKQKKISPYYSMSMGYGFALKNEREGISDTEGGWLVHPSVGIRLGAEKGLNTTLDIGYRFQRASYIRTILFNGDTEVRDLTFRRLMIRMGILF